MRFGPIPVADALGACVGHTLRLGGGAVLKKGTVLTEADLAALRAAGYAAILAAQLDEGDVAEDRAAAEIAAAAAGACVQVAAATTGRCNLHAIADGVLLVDRGRVDSVNLVDEAVTLATLEPSSPVRAGDLVATVKLIPFAARRAVVDACALAAARAVAVAPFRPCAAGLVLTRLPGTREGVLDRAAAAQRARVERLGGALAHELRCEHDEAAVAAAILSLINAGAALILVLGASAIVDRRDVIPAAIERAGGALVHLGMPVDPGNLLLLARRGEVPIVGVPGCARSLKRSGFDRVLEQLVAGLEVTSAALMRMGVGGLLGDIPARPHPRSGGDAPAPEPAIAAIVLGAGRSSRMGAANKLLVEVDGAPMIARVVDAILATRARPVVVVTGHDAPAVRAALAGREVTFVHNPRYAEGMSTSLRAGVVELGDAVDGALVCLGDMPRVRADHLEALLGAFDPEGGRAICVPVHEGRRGNPVLFAARYFPELRLLEGDVGARALLEKHAGAVCYVPIDDRGVTLDVDTPEALTALERS